MFSTNSLSETVQKRLADWQAADFIGRLWKKDPSCWGRGPDTPELVDRLGWLTLPDSMRAEARAIEDFAAEIRREEFRHAVVLGMGGSSLAPEVFQKTFGNPKGFPEILVLDSTHPDAVRTVEAKVDLSKTLFIVPSKSGTTIETLSFFKYFWSRVGRTRTDTGRQFVAITDPGTPLAELAKARGFRRTFLAPPDVGGRFSALTVFGLVPAALAGVDIGRILERACKMADACRATRAAQNPGALLGAWLGEAALAGRDKLTFLASPSLEAFPVWVEQLVAESTGKDGKGIVPVVDESSAPAESYAHDRFFVSLSLKGDAERGLQNKLTTLEAAGHPVFRIALDDKADLGQEFFRWEFATAAAGAVLGIQPFDQPDVQLAKDLAKKAMQVGPTGPVDCAEPVPRLPAPARAPTATRHPPAPKILDFLGCLRAGDYIAIQAFVEPSAANQKALEKFREQLRKKYQVATTLGFGPRFLHSTGQLHKGGADNGLFLQIVDEPSSDLAVPESDHSFGRLVAAQAEGDYEALKGRGRRVLRVDLGKDVSGGLQKLKAKFILKTRF